MGEVGPRETEPEDGRLSPGAVVPEFPELEKERPFQQPIRPLRNFPFYFFLRKAALPRAKFLWFLKMLHNPSVTIKCGPELCGATQSFLSDVWMRTDTASQLGKPLWFQGLQLSLLDTYALSFGF